MGLRKVAEEGRSQNLTRNGFATRAISATENNTVGDMPSEHTNAERRSGRPSVYRCTAGNIQSENASTTYSSLSCERYDNLGHAACLLHIKINGGLQDLIIQFSSIVGRLQETLCKRASGPAMPV